MATKALAVRIAKHSGSMRNGTDKAVQAKALK